MGPKIDRDELLTREVHIALRAAQRHTAVPVRVLDLLAASVPMLRALERMTAYHRWAKGGTNWRDEPEDPEAEANAALALARGES